MTVEYFWQEDDPDVFARIARKADGSQVIVLTAPDTAMDVPGVPCVIAGFDSGLVFVAMPDSIMRTVEVDVDDDLEVAVAKRESAMVILNAAAQLGFSWLE